MAEPDVRILVGNTGGASPSGESAKLIRDNLNKALAAGIKIKVGLNKSGSSEFKKQLQELATIQARVTGVVGSKTSKSTQTTTAATKEEAKAAAELAKAKLQSAQAIEKERLAHMQAVNAKKLEAETARTATAVMARDEKQRRIKVKLLEDEAKAAERAAKQEAQAQKAVASQDQLRATNALRLQNFNQYLTTLNPKGLQEFAGEINNIRTLLSSRMPEDAQKASVAMTQLKASMKSAGYEGGNIFTYLGAKIKTFVTYLLSSAITMRVVSGVREIVSNVRELDEALTNLRIVTGGTRDETEELLSTYNRMAQTLGSTTVDVAAGATDWLRQGYNQADTEELLTQSMTLSIVGDMDAEESTTSLTSALKGYRLEVEAASDVVDKFFAVDMAAATSSAKLAEALAKTAANAKLAGLDLNDVIGQLAAISEILQEDGSSTGVFYNTLLSRMARIKSGRLEDPETGESLNSWGVAA